MSFMSYCISNISNISLTLNFRMLSLCLTGQLMHTLSSLGPRERLPTGGGQPRKEGLQWKYKRGAAHCSSSVFHFHDEGGQ